MDDAYGELAARLSQHEEDVYGAKVMDLAGLALARMVALKGPLATVDIANAQ